MRAHNHRCRGNHFSREDFLSLQGNWNEHWHRRENVCNRNGTSHSYSFSTTSSFNFSPIIVVVVVAVRLTNAKASVSFFFFSLSRSRFDLFLYLLPLHFRTIHTPYYERFSFFVYFFCERKFIVSLLRSRRRRRRRRRRRKRER